MPPELAETLHQWWKEEDEEAAEAIGIEAAASMDVFSLGLAFVQMLDPYEEVLRDWCNRFEEDEQFYSWLAEPQQLEAVLQRRLSAVSDPLARGLADCMLVRDPESRASIQDCMQHSWFGNHQFPGY